MTSHSYQESGIGFPETAGERQDSLPEQPSTYRSAVDWGVAARLMFIPLVLDGTGIALLVVEEALGWIPLILGFLIGCVTGALYIPCRYTLSKERLIIRCGFHVESIPFARIRSINVVESSQRAPALSRTRVKIKLHRGERQISPQNRHEFLRELKGRAYL